MEQTGLTSQPCCNCEALRNSAVSAFRSGGDESSAQRCRGGLRFKGSECCVPNPSETPCSLRSFSKRTRTSREPTVPSRRDPDSNCYHAFIRHPTEICSHSWTVFGIPERAATGGREAVPV